MGNTRRGLARSLLALCVGLCVLLGVSSGASAVGGGFPGAEEIQSVAFKRDTDWNVGGLFGFKGLLSLTDAPVGVGPDYIAHRGGLSNFSTHTMSAGILKFCGVAGRESWCALRAHAERYRPGEFVRSVDTSLLLGSRLLYLFDVQRIVPNQLLGDWVWVSTFRQSDGTFRRLMTSTKAEWDNVIAMPYVFTASASTTPSWGWGGTQDARGYYSTDGAPWCYSAQNSRNTLDSRLPVVTGCNPAFTNWTHDLSRRVYIPAVVR